MNISANKIDTTREFTADEVKLFDIKEIKSTKPLLMLAVLILLLSKMLNWQVLQF